MIQKKEKKKHYDLDHHVQYNTKKQHLSLSSIRIKAFCLFFYIECDSEMNDDVDISMYTVTSTIIFRPELDRPYLNL